MKEILKKSIPYVILIAVLGFAYVLYDAYKKSRSTQGWINGLKNAYQYYNPNTGDWRPASGWTEEVNEFVRTQAALPKFQGKSIEEVIQANIDWSYKTSHWAQKLFIKV